MYFGRCVLNALTVLLPFTIFLFVKSLLFSLKHNKMKGSGLNTFGYASLCLSVFLRIKTTSLRVKPLLSANEQLLFQLENRTNLTQ